MRAEHLVKANGILESATIAAILIGSVVGGALTDWSVEGATLSIAAGYVLATGTALLIPQSEHAHSQERFSPRGSLRIFAGQTRTLWRQIDVRVAILGTSMFWGAGAALRFLVITWVPESLHMDNNRVAGFLTGMVAAGIAVGAALAAKFVRTRPSAPRLARRCSHRRRGVPAAIGALLAAGIRCHGLGGHREWLLRGALGRRASEARHRERWCGRRHCHPEPLREHDHARSPQRHTRP